MLRVVEPQPRIYIGIGGGVGTGGFLRRNAEAKPMPIKGRAPDVVEPGLVTDIFITGILPLEDHGENVRLIGYVEQRFPAGGDLARVVTVRLVMPKASLTDASVIFNAAVASMHF